MKRNSPVPAFVRPAILEVILLCTLGGASIFAVLAGVQMQCTALLEFGLLSALACASAATLFARYAMEICGFLADYRLFERWGGRFSTLGYTGLGLYALANGVLDLAVPRHEPDAVSYSGLLSTVAAVVVVALVVHSKYRALEDLPSRSLFESLADDALYLQIGAVTLISLVGHVLAPSWWLDTATDAIVLIFLAVKLQQMERSRF